MTIRLKMLRVAGRARHLLNDSGASVIRFVRSRFQDGGGFRGRGRQSDLYYTVFAMESLLALRAELPVKDIEAYLLSFQGGESLDLVHLACLGRCWADLPGKEPPGLLRAAILARIESCRLRGGGYGNRPEEETGSVYHGFLAKGAYQDLCGSLPNATALARWVKPADTDPTPLMAGAVILLEELGAEVPDVSKEWLLSRHHERGGFFVNPAVPIPDLLSTATALHALAGMGVSLETVRTPCLEFVHSLQSGEGGFQGMGADRVVDCEYTYYGLLALGHLEFSPPN